MKLQDVMRQAIEIKRRNGFVTFDQLNEWLPAATTEPEDIETLMEALRDEGINLVDNKPT